MAFYDIFNGDADGLCALHQLRSHEPCDSVLITGVKRDTALVGKVRAQAADFLTVLDVSLDSNKTALMTALNAGARCLYFDHHHAQEIPLHPGLEAHINSMPDTCTSLIVDGYLSGRYRAWAVVAAFGDNLISQAHHAALPLALSPPDLASLRALGENLNYNAYGATVDDLYYHPAELFKHLQRYADPLEFLKREEIFGRLQEGYAADLDKAKSIEAIHDSASHFLIVLPNEKWARRVVGAFANWLVLRHPNRAHAVLVHKNDSYIVSVRAPQAKPIGADLLCRSFPTGNGRSAAAGINDLEDSQLKRFEHAFLKNFIA